MSFRLRPTFRDALAEASRPLTGMWVCSGSPLVAEICAGAGLDWLLVDMEHSPNGLESVLAQLQAVAAEPVTPVVRVPIGDVVTINGGRFGTDHERARGVGVVAVNQCTRVDLQQITGADLAQCRTVVRDRGVRARGHDRLESWRIAAEFTHGAIEGQGDLPLGQARSDLRHQSPDGVVDDLAGAPQ